MNRWGQPYFSKILVMKARANVHSGVPFTCSSLCQPKVHMGFLSITLSPLLYPTQYVALLLGC